MKEEYYSVKLCGKCGRIYATIEVGGRKFTTEVDKIEDDILNYIVAAKKREEAVAKKIKKKLEKEIEERTTNQKRSM